MLSDFVSHGQLFEQIIAFNECKTIVEIGVAYGTTSKYLCAGASKHGGHLYGFDVWERHGLQSQFAGMSCKEEVENYLQDSGYSNYTMFKINSKTIEFDNILQSLPKIDFAFIDGCHSYEGIKNDFDKVYPLLNLPGIIAFHDTLRIDGCREFILNLRKHNDGTYDIVDFPYGNGNRRVGVSLLVKRNYPYLNIDIDEDCGSLSPRAKIIEDEKKWYSQSIKQV